MKKIIWLLLFFPFSLLAQKSHKVEPKESLYSIGRKYKVHPRELAEYNNITLSEGVQIGQVIKIPSKKKMEPLGDENASETKSAKQEKKEIKNEDDIPSETKSAKKQKKESNSEEEVIVSEKKSDSKGSSAPIMHKVQKKETLYQISKKNNVSVDDIKKWNHLSADGVNEGSELIVGYEKGNSNLKDSETDQTSNTTKATTKKETKKAVTNDDEITISSNETVTSDKKEEKNNNSKKNTTEVKDYKGGYFASDYNQQINDKSTPSEQKGTASSFKSTSGWDDGRYYCLYNSAPSGTIVKVLNPSNQKYIYAKVLDVIPDLKQNEGVAIIVSKAASEQLSVTTDKFDVELSY
jgi:LysM repeat protein